MKREEEIFQRAKEIGKFIANTSPSTYNAALRGFCRGAKYADKTMLDRACEWFEPRLTALIGREDAEELITAFRQAMKGE